jgi:hypothetical protein
MISFTVHIFLFFTFIFPLSMYISFLDYLIIEKIKVYFYYLNNILLLLVIKYRSITLMCQKKFFLSVLL